MAKRNTKSQTSNLVRKIGTKPSKPVASDKMKSTAAGFQMKFNKMNVSNFVTGGSTSTSPSANYGNQSTIHSIAGKKVGTATQIPQLVAPETIETKSDDSLISSLAKMFSFMQQTRDDDVKRRETEKSFAEEKKTEEQKRHEQFLKVLKDYTSIGTTTLAPSSGDSGNGFMDFVKSMIDSILEKFAWVKELFELTKYMKPLLNILGAIGGTGILTVLLGAGAGVALAAYIKDALEKSTEAMFKEHQERSGRYVENASVDQAQSAQKQLQSSIQGSEAIRVKQGFVEQYMKEKGYTKYAKTFLGLTTGYEYKKGAGDNATAPEPLLKEANDYAEKEIQKNLALPEGVTPSRAGGGRGMGGPTATEMSTASPSPVIATPTAAPVPPTPSTSSVNDVIAKNADLVMNESTSSSSGTTQPIVASSSNSTSSPDKAMSSSATQRDDTAIINRVFDRVRGGV
jgi:hypothetical protein